MPSRVWRDPQLDFLGIEQGFDTLKGMRGDALRDMVTNEGVVVDGFGGEHRGREGGRREAGLAKMLHGGGCG